MSNHLYEDIINSIQQTLNTHDKPLSYDMGKIIAFLYEHAQIYLDKNLPITTLHENINLPRNWSPFKVINMQVHPDYEFSSNDELRMISRAEIKEVDEQNYKYIRLNMKPTNMIRRYQTKVIEEIFPMKSMNFDEYIILRTICNCIVKLVKTYDHIPTAYKLMKYLLKIVHHIQKHSSLLLGIIDDYHQELLKIFQKFHNFKDPIQLEVRHERIKKRLHKLLSFEDWIKVIK